jgi:CBS-domain-containing membrane protein
MTGSLPSVFAHRSTDLLQAVKLMKTGFDRHGEKVTDLLQSTLHYSLVRQQCESTINEKS